VLHDATKIRTPLAEVIVDINRRYRIFGGALFELGEPPGHRQSLLEHRVRLGKIEIVDYVDQQQRSGAGIRKTAVRIASSL
jgi:hypothetical protein